MRLEDNYTELNHLEYAEFHVVDGCNLNCNACSHFSPMVREEFDHLPSFKSDLQRLRELFEYIIHIRLLGGEPFLENRLDEFAAYARSLYPFSKIEVVTNGLLVPKASKRVLEALAEHDIIVNVTLYPPTERIRKAIAQRLESHSIRYSFSEPVVTFRKRFSPEGQNVPKQSFDECVVGRKCTFIYLGKLYLCSGAALVKYYNAYTRSNIVCKDSYIDLYQASAEEILAFLNRENDGCRYCGKVSEEPWSVCGDFNNIDVGHWITSSDSSRKVLA